MKSGLPRSRSFFGLDVGRIKTTDCYVSLQENQMDCDTGIPLGTHWLNQRSFSCHSDEITLYQSGIDAELTSVPGGMCSRWLPSVHKAKHLGVLTRVPWPV